MMKILILLFSFSFSGWAKSIDLQRFQLGSLEVVYLPDHRFPDYNLSIYFADGALSEPQGKLGLTELTLNEIFSGTTRFNQAEISDLLEYYGVGFSSNVTHEYSQFAISGLVKDSVPTFKMVCHLFQNATFPETELNKTKQRLISGLKNLPSNHSALANHIFRQLSLAETPFEGSTSGSLDSLPRIKTSDLKEHLDYLKTKVKKKIFVTGPPSIIPSLNIFKDECFSETSDNFVRVVSKTEQSKKSPQLVFVEVPGANQAQIRIGRYLSNTETSDDDLMTVMTQFLGGGFTSVLNREVRVKRGLTYSIGAYGGYQKFYGRAGISTSTKNESVLNTLEVIRQTIERVKTSISKEELTYILENLSGRHLFQFEQSSALLGNILFLDHLNKDVGELLYFPKRIQKFTAKDLEAEAKRVFDWKDQTILILGDGSLKKQIKALGDFQIKNFKDFL